MVNNADDTDILFGFKEANGITDYLPQSKEGVILLTIRTLEIADSLIRSHVVGLRPMNRQVADQQGPPP